MFGCNKTYGKEKGKLGFFHEKFFQDLETQL